MDRDEVLKVKIDKKMSKCLILKTNAMLKILSSNHLCLIGHWHQDFSPLKQIKFLFLKSRFKNCLTIEKYTQTSFHIQSEAQQTICHFFHFYAYKYEQKYFSVWSPLLSLYKLQLIEDCTGPARVSRFSVTFSSDGNLFRLE